MPNTLAFLMLAIWPFITGALFLRLSPGRALVVSLLGAYLLLPPPPAAFDFPLMPPLNKESIASVSALAAVLVWHRENLEVLPKSWLARLLLFVFVCSPVATVLTNPEPVVFERNSLPGLRLIEALALVVQQALLILPFLLGRCLLGSTQGLRTILTALVVGGLLYSLPMLLEVRLSPQINVWVYGYFQHSFEQMIRFGGFRPIVFLLHGLWAAFFMMSTFIAALALYRGTEGAGAKAYLLVAGYLGLVLALCKTLAAALYGLVMIPLVLFLGRVWQIRIAAVLAALTLVYPALKQVDLVPVEFAVSQAERIDAGRAASLRFRFDNEDALFDRAREKALFGWGSWGRNQLHNPITGEIISVSDGRWIITFGIFGLIGYLAEIGLLALPLIALWRETRQIPAASIPVLVGPLALLIGVNLVDFVPNATLTPITWLIAGALLGVVENLHETYRPPVIEPLKTVL